MSDRISLPRLLRECGPFTRITKEQAVAMCPLDSNRVFTHHISGDNGTWYGQVGFGIVNVEAYFEMAKARPDARLQDYLGYHVFNVFHGEDGLPD